MPRWVKRVGVVGTILAVVFVVLHLTGGQLGGHLPQGHDMHAPGAASQ